MSKKISIIIPCYNAADTVGESWRSLKEQTMNIEELECIFVDDASTDDGHIWGKLQEIERVCPGSVVAVYLTENMRQGGRVTSDWSTQAGNT